jgi:AcrR family transcriptional regulator
VSTGLSNDFLFVRKRARPMSPDERRAHILDAVIPLLQANGRDVSTRDIAEAAGVAEGTLFRAFGDKDSIISAAIEKFFDPEPFRNALRGIDPDDATDDKIHQVVEILRGRFEGVIGFMSALRQDGPPPGRGREDDGEWLAILGRVFRQDELSVPVETFAHFARTVAFSAAIPPLNLSHRFTTDELVGLISRGVVATQHPQHHPDQGKKN